MMQMTQFCAMMIQAFCDTYYSFYKAAPGEKTYPTHLSILLIVYMWSMLGLFADFLIKDRARIRRERAHAKAQKAE